MFGSYFVQPWQRTTARGALAMMPCPGIGRHHGGGVFWIAGADIRWVYSNLHVYIQDYGL
jgi:hypothetical protein